MRGNRETSTHKPRGPTHQPRGAFDSIQRAPSASNLGLNKSKRTHRHHNKKDSIGAPQRPKPETNPQPKTQIIVMTPHDPNTGLTNARLRLTNNLPLKDPVGINDNHKTQTDQHILWSLTQA